MFYVFSTGIITIPANTKINLSNTMYSDFHIKLTELTTVVDAGVGSRDNILVNWRIQKQVKFHLNADSPIDHILGTPQYPYILKEPIEFERNYLELIINNKNANAVTLCIAFIGTIFADRVVDLNYDKASASYYNYQLTDAITSSINVSDGKATLPIGPNFSGTVATYQTYADYFEIKELNQTLFIPYDTTISFRVDRTTVPIINKPIYTTNLFGDSNQKYKMKDSLWLKNGENLYVDVTHNQIAPFAPFDISFNFGGFIYNEKR